MTAGTGTGSLVYVYAVARDDAALAERAPRLGGLGTAPRLLTTGGLAALVSDVPEEEFGTDALTRQLEDLDRLETIARAHHGLIESAAAHTTVLPLRMTTVYRDETRVREVLTERADAFTEALARLQGHVELGVKVFAEPDDVQEEIRPEAGDAEEASPGRAYLQRRRAQRHRRRDTYEAAGATAGRVARSAAGLARATVSHRVQQGALATSRGENVANDAYLVPAAEADRFRSAMAELSAPERGVRVEVTGPWAPYSFTDWAQSPQDRHVR
ncbi:GvpL/GvpF family gas vesicle protein [Streptomyces sp. NPDC090119]|uniref:GvpL/GvpF family gas vesicle protein n=1 Tax=Streptomyces sp. NPDC090119 TaxID=3365951 RepID=UPI00382D094C